MNFKILCIFAAVIIAAVALPSGDYKPYPTQSALIDQHELSRIRRSPEDDKKKEEPEFRFKVGAEDSKQDGRSLQGGAQWKAWESENGRHKIEAYGQGYIRDKGDKYRYQPDNQRDSNYKVGTTYEYTFG